MVGVGRRGDDPPSEPGEPAASTGDGLVGRQREMAALRDALDAAVSRHGRLVLLSGERGSARAGWRTSWAGWRISEGRWCCGVVAGKRAEPHTGLGSKPSARSSWAWTKGIAAARRCRPAEVVQILPGSDRRLPNCKTPGDPEGRGSGSSTVTSFLVHTARVQPVVLIIDDLQAADVPSLLLLQFLAGELPQAACS